MLPVSPALSIAIGVDQGLTASHIENCSQCIDGSVHADVLIKSPPTYLFLEWEEKTPGLQSAFSLLAKRSETKTWGY
jgi:hypothetical protein